MSGECDRIDAVEGGRRRFRPAREVNGVVLSRSAAKVSVDPVCAPRRVARRPEARQGEALAAQPLAERWLGPNTLTAYLAQVERGVSPLSLPRRSPPAAQSVRDRFGGRFAKRQARALQRGHVERPPLACPACRRPGRVARRSG